MVALSVSWCGFSGSSQAIAPQLYVDNLKSPKAPSLLHCFWLPTLLHGMFDGLERTLLPLSVSCLALPRQPGVARSLESCLMGLGCPARLNVDVFAGKFRASFVLD